MYIPLGEKEGELIIFLINFGDYSAIEANADRK